MKNNDIQKITKAYILAKKPSEEAKKVIETLSVYLCNKTQVEQNQILSDLLIRLTQSRDGKIK